MIKLRHREVKQLSKTGVKSRLTHSLGSTWLYVRCTRRSLKNTDSQAALQTKYIIISRHWIQKQMFVIVVVVVVLCYLGDSTHKQVWELLHFSILEEE